MSDPSTQRLVKYMLTVEVSPEAEQQRKRFVEFMKLSQSEVDDAVKKSSTARVEAEKNAADRITEMQQQQLRVLEDINRQSTTLVDMKLAEQARLEEEARQARERREGDALRRLEEQYKRHTETVKRSSREITDGYIMASEGLIKITQGAATMGVLSEESTEKMLRLVVTIRAVADTAKGGVEIYRGVTAAVEAYRASVLAAAAAEAALNAARAKGGGVGLGGAAAGAAGSAAGAAGSAASGLGTAIGGLSLGVAALPAAIAAALASVVAAGAMVTNIGGARDKAAGMIPVESVDPTTTAGRWLGTADWVLANSSPLAMASGAVGGLSGEQEAARNSADVTQRRQMERANRLAMFDRQNANAQGQFDLQQQLTDMRFARMSAAGTDPQEQLAQAMSVLQSARQGSATAGAMAPGMMREAEMGRAADAEVAALNRVIDLRKQSLAMSQQEARERLTGVKEETSEMMRQLDIAKKQKEEADNRLKSAKERFGAMDEATQRKTIEAKQKADRQGAASLTREERALLRGVGTSGASDIASEGDIAAAEAAGFSNYFGGNERSQAAQAEAEKTRLEAKIKVQRELKIKIEDDIDKLTDQVADVMAVHLEERDKLLEEKIVKRIRDQQAKNNQQPPPGSTNVGS